MYLEFFGSTPRHQRPKAAEAAVHNDAGILGLGFEVGPEEIGEVGDIISKGECSADNGH